MSVANIVGPSESVYGYFTLQILYTKESIEATSGVGRTESEMHTWHFLVPRVPDDLQFSCTVGPAFSTTNNVQLTYFLIGTSNYCNTPQKSY